MLKLSQQGPLGVVAFMFLLSCVSSAESDRNHAGTNLHRDSYSGSEHRSLELHETAVGPIPATFSLLPFPPFINFATLVYETVDVPPHVDDFPPLPDPAVIGVQPVLALPDLLVMEAVQGLDPLGDDIEYFFEELSGTGKTSGWINTPVYRIHEPDLAPETIWRVKMRNSRGKETSWSSTSEALHQPHIPYHADEDTGLIVIDAADYSLKSTGLSGREWINTTMLNGYTGSGAMLVEANAGLVVDSNVTVDSPRIDYDVLFPEAGNYWIWVRSRTSTHGSIHLGLNLDMAQWGRNMYLGTGVFQWNLHRNRMRIEQPGLNRISIWMRKEGVALDRIVLTTDGDYMPWEHQDINGNLLGPGPAATPRVPLPSNDDPS